MDKFGIFKLLNSFFNFYGQKSGDFANNEQQKTSQNQAPILELLNALNNKKTNGNQTSQSQKNEAATPPAFMPLQADMIKTINSHDALIKRVKQKHLNPNNL